MYMFMKNWVLPIITFDKSKNTASVVLFFFKQNMLRLRWLTLQFILKIRYLKLSQEYCFNDFRQEIQSFFNKIWAYCSFYKGFYRSLYWHNCSFLSGTGISKVKLSLKFLYTPIQPFLHHKYLLLSYNSWHLHSVINNIQACIENIYRLQSMYTKKIIKWWRTMNKIHKL